VDYVIECYAGVEREPGTKPRRVFIWEDERDGEVYMGNCEAFLLHLKQKFALLLPLSAASQIHQLLRDLGETVYAAAEDRASPRPGRRTFKQPEPDQWRLPTRPTL
jgi:hypothetical protein